MTGPNWNGQAACASLEARGLPWTHDTDRVPSALVNLMAATCATCPVLLSCSEYVTTHGVTGGFWAGKDRDPECGAGQDVLFSVDTLAGAR